MFIEEFLYRDTGVAGPAWHVVIGAKVDDGFGGQTLVLKGPLTPAQAFAGHQLSLSSVIADLNVSVMVDRDRQRARAISEQARADGEKTRADTAEAALAALQTQIEAAANG
jgi:hypothetical protein